MSQDARIDEEQSTQRRARLLGLSYFDTSVTGEKTLYREVLTVAELYQLRIVPLQADAHRIHFGITNTTSQQTMSNFRQRFADQRISFSLISDAGYREYMRLYDPPKQVVYQDITIGKSDSAALLAQVSATLDQVKADDMLAYLTQQAHRLGASDIHIETQSQSVRIRFRIDGVLHPVAQLSHQRTHMLISAIASAANVSTSANTAQQGHIAHQIKMANNQVVSINLRVETVPAINGMDIVMRLFNMEASNYTLDRLGLGAAERKVLDGIISKPSGLVLAVGPTGSGKTTTLYSMLNTLNSIERKIITIEDPVEYQFDGITQISVTTQSADQSQFADKLRAVLRLDPDIVMVGEIRDTDTAKTALQASLTGHLVLSTFHAGSAAAALTRLLDIIDENPLFLSAVRLIMAQRLVRRLDDATKQAYVPDQQMIIRLQQIVSTFPPGVQQPNLSSLQLFRPGKSDDNPFGYKGQVALREQLLVTPSLQELLTHGGRKLTTQIIEDAAVGSGMLTMLHNAVLRLVAGETTAEEVFRVLG